MDPQFATVCLVPEDGSRGGTFRVPVAADTTVRQLAKDAMQRLVLSRRNSGDDKAAEIPNISVSEVRVGGSTSEHAEIFKRDCVAHVVLLKEETVYMKVRAAPAAAAAAPEKVVVPLPQAQAPVNVSTQIQDVGPTATAARKVPAAAAAASAAASKRPREAVEEREEAAPRVRPGWGPDASKHFPDNYVSSPEKIARRAQLAKRQPAASKGERSTAVSSHECATKDAAVIKKKVDVKDAAMEKKTIVKTVEVKKTDVQKTDSSDAPLPPGWGPEAYKNFPSNYVASPDRLARELRRQRKLQQSATTGSAPSRTSAPAPAPAPASACVAPAPQRAPATRRQLEFSSEEVATEKDEEATPPAQRSTVGHRVAPIVVEDEPALPKGWGCEAAKFFDPETYCDDPRKANINFIGRARPARAGRRSGSA